MKRTKAPVKAVPKGLSRREEARFWEEHDFADFWASTHEVDVRVARSFALRARAGAKKRLVAIRLAEWQIEEAKRIAHKKHVPYQALLRRWISRGIVSERKATGRR